MMSKFMMLALAILSCRVSALPAGDYNLVQNILSGYGNKDTRGVDGDDQRTPTPTTPRPTPMPVNAGPPSANAVNCREFVHPRVTSQTDCSNVKQSDFIGGVPVSQSANAYCRWDFSSNACFCPRTKDLCDSVKQCYWNRDPSLSGNPLASLGTTNGECISNAERFYVILSNLLMKRGKKDFAIRINYSSAPARGQLPLGPYGGAIIGGGGSIPGMIPPPYNTPPVYPMGTGDPLGGYGIPNQVYPNMFGAPMPSYSLPYGRFP